MLLKSVLDVLLPRFCAICGRRLMQEEEGICLHCNVELPRTYHWEHPTDNEVARRLYGRLRVERAASYIYHVPKTDTASVVYDFKYHHDPRLARSVGIMMAQEIGPEYFSGIDGIVPIPITEHRRRQRGGYNQSERIAQGISRVTGIRVCEDVVMKAKDTASQTLLSHVERMDNLDDAFVLHSHAERYRGKHLLIVDDVITTGATTISCGKVIEGIPGVRLSVLGFACIRG